MTRIIILSSSSEATFFVLKVLVVSGYDASANGKVYNWEDQAAKSLLRERLKRKNPL